MRKNKLLCGVAAGSVMLGTLPLEVRAQQSLPTIDVGAPRRTAARPGPRTDGPVTATQGSDGSDEAGDGSGSGSGSYWQQLAEKAKIPEGSYVAPYASTGTRTATPIMNTPLNVQVVTPQVLIDRQITTIEGAVKNVSGVTFTPSFQNGFGGNIAIRGFETSSYFRNGFRNDFEGLDASSQQFANVESVEILKGSSAILYGLVEPGGILNVITKKPQEKPAYSAQQQIGSFQTYRTSIGATGPITQDKSVLYRVDMSYNNAHSFVDLLRDDSIFIAPVVKWNITPRTQATLEFEYNKSNQSVFLPFTPTYNNQILRIPRSRNYGERSPFGAERFLFGFNWSHEFNNDWKLAHQIQYIRKSSNEFALFPFGITDTGDGVFVSRGGVSYYNKRDAFSTNVNLTGRFHTGELEHTLLLGGDFYRTNSYLGEYDTAFDSLIDAFNPIHPGTPPSMTPVFSIANVITTYNTGIYLQDQIKLPFGLHLMGGVRYQNTVQVSKQGDLHANNYTANDPAAAQRVTPRVGALWRPVDWLSIYGNYAEGFGPNSGLIYPDKPIPPSDARQYEFGAKMEFFDSKLRATAAYFNISKTNVPTADLAHPGFSLITGEVNAKGVEFDLQGEVLPGWNVILAYANTEALVTKSNDTDANGVSTVGSRFFNVPRNTASLWTTYEFLHDDFKGLKFGGGVTYRDAQRIFDGSDARNLSGIAAYATVDLMGAYSFDVARRKVTAQLNVTNLLDHTYYTNGQNFFPPSQGYAFNLRAYGEPRKFLGSLSMAF